MKFDEWMDIEGEKVVPHSLAVQIAWEAGRRIAIEECAEVMGHHDTTWFEFQIKDHK